MDPLLIRVHHLFRAAAEGAKTFRWVERGLEAVVVALAILGVVLSEQSRWRLPLPMVAIVVAIIAMACRFRVSRLRSYSERCRRVAVQGYALGLDHFARSAADDLVDDVPVGVSGDKRIVGQSIDDYYDVASCPPGPTRALEMYACSAFFTTRNLAVHARWQLGFAVLVGIAFALAFYLTAFEFSASRELKQKVLEIMSVLLVAGCVVLLERSSDASSASRSIAGIEAKLLKLDHSNPDMNALKTLIAAYDAEHFAAPLIPSWIYWGRRDAMNTRWAERRANHWRPQATAPANANGTRTMSGQAGNVEPAGATNG